jgi:hypothetical protein
MIRSFHNSVNSIAIGMLLLNCMTEAEMASKKIYLTSKFWHTAQIELHCSLKPNETGNTSKPNRVIPKRGNKEIVRNRPGEQNCKDCYSQCHLLVR